MKSRSADALWMFLAFFGALALAAGVLGVLGTEERGLHAALAATARFAFLLFWPAYSSSALVLLFGASFQPVKQHAREFGLGFVSALTVHLALVGWLCLIGAPPAVSTFVFFGVAAGCAYLLALFSIRALQQALGSKFWRFLSKVGMNYIALAFFVDFAKQPIQGPVRHVVEYLPFAVLAAAGPSLRLATLVWRIRSTERHAAND